LGRRARRQLLRYRGRLRGRAEREGLARLRRERTEPFYIATKAGRRLRPHTAEGYTRDNLTAFVERSLSNLECDALDLLQLHCPPTDVYYQPHVFGVLDDLVRAGKLRFYGVSVERVEEGLKAIEFPGVQSVQIIYNVLRQRPADLFFREAAKKQVGVIARLPLASGLLAGKMGPGTRFEADDHRAFNRRGEVFDRGETFSGVEFDRALAIVEKLRPLVPPGVTMGQWALRWILEQPAVTTVIPGAKLAYQVEENAAAADLPAPSADALAAVQRIYDEHVKPLVHGSW
jgi:aryl-alcohol dehydrogenase-like predicted oxidoreductase